MEMMNLSPLRGLLNNIDVEKCGNADGHWVCGDLAVTDLTSTDDKLGTNCDRFGTKGGEE